MPHNVALEFEACFLPPIMLLSQLALRQFSAVLYHRMTGERMFESLVRTSDVPDGTRPEHVVAGYLSGHPGFYFGRAEDGYSDLAYGVASARLNRRPWFTR
jgi:hypothetical protein